jgi:hypothetical protein
MVLHSRAAWAALLWSAAAASSWAQPASTPAKRPDPSDAQASVPPLVYRPAVAKSPPPVDVPVGSWPNANETVWRIGGWRTYAREAAQPAPAASQPGARP